ncbi:lipolytic enzyme [Polychaeton citri CBS 116435]|uniref:Lipolytic enzyme n=1 Tax=Polychaeton citri CBS 116435 TaxID=1314669 RepID=A0A9P4ULP3_9PEZI|nr:lipolytic enzyme [Polychaeton citri CBS 116435]
MDQFLLFGDSITQQSFSQSQPPGRGGFAFNAALSNAYIRRLDIVNRGLSGYNTTQALRVLPQVIPRPETARLRFLTVFFGANDARLPNTPGSPQQSVDLPLYMENLRQIIQHPCVQAHEGTRIIVITPPPVEERLGLQIDKLDAPEILAPKRTALNAGNYAEAAKGVAGEMNVACLDLWSFMMERAGFIAAKYQAQHDLPGSLVVEENEMLRSWLHDGLHFSPAGYEILYEALMDLISKVWPDQLPENLPMVLPDWKDESAWR